MKINWQVRLKNPVFWMQLAAAVLAPILAAAGMSWEQVTSWAALWQVLGAGIGNPVVVVAVLAAIWGIINDPTTAGLSDSAQALTYETPKKDTDSEKIGGTDE